MINIRHKHSFVSIAFFTAREKQVENMLSISSFLRLKKPREHLPTSVHTVKCRSTVWLDQSHLSLELGTCDDQDSLSLTHSLPPSLRPPVARSLARSLTHSLASSLDRSLTHSLPRSGSCCGSGCGFHAFFYSPNFRCKPKFRLFRHLAHQHTCNFCNRIIFAIALHFQTNIKYHHQEVWKNLSVEIQR